MTDAEALMTLRTIEAMPDEDCDIFLAIRDRLINADDDFDLNIEIAPELLANITNAVLALDTQNLSLMRLAYSLCPLHGCDYASCFDDDDEDCAEIRQCFPDHDT